MIRLLYILVASLVLPGFVAAEFRIATVDVNQVLNQSKEAKDKRKDLDVKSAEAKKKIEAKGKTLKDLEKKLKDEKVAESSKEADDFRAQAKELDRLVKDSEEDLRKEFLRVNRSVANKAISMIIDYAKANQIDLVLDKGEAGRGPVLYGSQSFDITGEILKRMNE